MQERKIGSIIYLESKMILYNFIDSMLAHVSPRRIASNPLPNGRNQPLNTCKGEILSELRKIKENSKGNLSSVSLVLLRNERAIEEVINV